MSNSITLEDFYKLFQESERQRQETERILRESLERSRSEFDHRLAESKEEADRRAAEADRRAAEADRRAAESKEEFDRHLAESKEEADRRAAEADRRAAESKEEFDRRLAESKEEFDRRLAESKEEADRRAAEAEQRLGRTEAIAEQTNKAVNSLSSRWGRFVENIVAPGVLRLFQERGIAVQEVYQRMKSGRGSENLEIDIFAVDDEMAVAVEVKSRLTQDDVRHFLKNLERFKTAFPHYGNYRIYGAMAAIEIDASVDTYGENQGLFIIKQAGDSVCISNKADFTPRTW